MGYSATQQTQQQSLQTGRYDECLTRLLVGLMDLDDHHGDALFHKILLEAPVITNNAISIIKKYCAEPKVTARGMKSLQVRRKLPLNLTEKKTICGIVPSQARLLDI